MSLLSLAQDVCYEVGIEPPASIINNDDDDARRLLALFNTEGKRLMRRFEWQKLVKEITFSATGVESQGQLSAIASDVDRIIGDTFYNRDNQRQTLGASNAQEWQYDKARSSTNLNHVFRLRGGEVLLNPVPASGDTLAFEYVSKNWAETFDGASQKASFTVDTDEPLIDEDILKLGVKWRLRAAIGTDFQNDLAEYQEQIKLRFGADTPKGAIDMGAGGLNSKVGVIIARGA